jgi:hypothetical protein
LRERIGLQKGDSQDRLQLRSASVMHPPAPLRSQKEINKNRHYASEMTVMRARLLQNRAVAKHMLNRFGPMSGKSVAIAVMMLNK